MPVALPVRGGVGEMQMQGRWLRSCSIMAMLVLSGAGVSACTSPATSSSSTSSGQNAGVRVVSPGPIRAPGQIANSRFTIDDQGRLWKVTYDPDGVLTVKVYLVSDEPVHVESVRFESGRLMMSGVVEVGDENARNFSDFTPFDLKPRARGVWVQGTFTFVGCAVSAPGGRLGTANEGDSLSRAVVSYERAGIASKSPVRLAHPIDIDAPSPSPCS